MFNMCVFVRWRTPFLIANLYSEHWNIGFTFNVLTILFFPISIKCLIQYVFEQRISKNYFLSKNKIEWKMKDKRIIISKESIILHCENRHNSAVKMRNYKILIAIKLIFNCRTNKRSNVYYLFVIIINLFYYLKKKNLIASWSNIIIVNRLLIGEILLIFQFHFMHELKIANLQIKLPTG